MLWKFKISNYNMTSVTCFFLQVLTAIGNFCICSIAVGMILEIIVMFPIQHRSYRDGINNLLVLLIGGIPIAMPTVLSVTLAIGSHRLSQQVQLITAISQLYDKTTMKFMPPKFLLKISKMKWKPTHVSSKLVQWI